MSNYYAGTNAVSSTSDGYPWVYCDKLPQGWSAYEPETNTTAYGTTQKEAISKLSGYADNAKQADAALDSITYAPPTPKYRTLSESFLKLMDEIGTYGLEKYGERSTIHRFAKGDFSRDDRTKAREFARHAANHFDEYLDGVKHDKFNTREHQLAAAAFNAMLEYQFYKETAK